MVELALEEAGGAARRAKWRTVRLAEIRAWVAAQPSDDGTEDVLTLADDVVFLVSEVDRLQEVVGGCWECSGEQLMDHLCQKHQADLIALVAPGEKDG